MMADISFLTSNNKKGHTGQHWYLNDLFQYTSDYNIIIYSMVIYSIIDIQTYIGSSVANLKDRVNTMYSNRHKKNIITYKL